MNIDRSQHYQLLLDSFSVQFDNEEFADCALIAEGKSIKVHRAILCSNSNFLQKIVADHKDLDLTFIIDGIRFDDLYLVAQFLYRGNIAISGDQVRSVLLVAELLGMKWISDVSVVSNRNAVESTSVNAGKLAIPASSTKLLLPLKNITNTLSTKARKRRKDERSRKSPKKIKIEKKHLNKSSLSQAIVRDKSSHVKSRLETDLAQMDENTFCTALGLKKNIEVRDLMKIDNSSSFCRAVPPLLKMLSNVKSKFSEVNKVSESANSLCETNPVYIEAKNLSFLNIDANELYIRENNIEIECDVLDATSHNLLFDKGNDVSGNVLQLSAGNSAREIDNPVSDASLAEYQRRTLLAEYILFRQAAMNWNEGERRFEHIPGLYPHPLDPTSVRKHRDRSKQESRWECDRCGKRYKYSRGLAMHRRLECGKEPMFHCPYCPQKCHQKALVPQTPPTIRVRSDIPNLKPLNFQNLTTFALLSTTNNFNVQNSASTASNVMAISQHYLNKLTCLRMSPSHNWVSSSCDMYDSSSDTSVVSGDHQSITPTANNNLNDSTSQNNGGGPRKHNREKEPIYGCLDCGKRYRSKTSLSLHKRLECGKEPAFQCPFCPLKTHQKGNLQVHIKKKHSDPRHFIGHQMS